MGEIATRQLTDMQAAFVRHLADCGDPGTAAAKAGSNRYEPSKTAAEMLRVPHVLAALQIEVRRKLAAGAPMALKVITDLACDTTLSPKVRLDAAKILLERAGHVAPRAAAEKPADQPLHEMSTDQLRELAGRLEDEIAGRAKDVSSAIPAPQPANDIDIIG